MMIHVEFLDMLFAVNIVFSRRGKMGQESDIFKYC